MRNVLRVCSNGRRRVVAALVTSSVSVAMVSGCAVAVDPADVAPAVYVEQPTLSASATAKDAQAARAAAAWARDFVLSHSFDKRFLDPQRAYSEQELVSAVQADLSPDAKAYWQSEVAKAVAGDREALHGLNVLTYVAAKEESLRPAADEEPVRSQAITGIEVTVDESTQLYSVTLDYDAELRLYDKRKPHDVDATKSVSFLLSPADPPASALPAATEAPTSPASAPGARGSWIIEHFEGDLELETQ